MTGFTKHFNFLKNLGLIGLACALVLAGSFWQERVLRVQASVQVLLVSRTAIAFGDVFPGENQAETYTVQLDTSANSAIYATALEPLPDLLNLCPFLDLHSIDFPSEADTLGKGTLTASVDGVDKWQVTLKVPGIKGQLSQDHDGGIIVIGGDYGCKIIITTDTPVLTTVLSSSTIFAGGTAHDTAVLNNVTPDAGGTVTYKVYSDDQCQNLFASAGVVNVANGIVPDSQAVTFNDPGTYYWQAGYSGDSNNNPVLANCQDEILVVKPPKKSPTRTLGFWQTHTYFSKSIFDGIKPVTLGGMNVNDYGKLFGGFYASIPKTSTGAKRSGLDQARMQLAQQYLAAVLNCAAFTCPANIQSLIIQASTDFSTGTASQILADASALDTYNNSGDSIPSNLNQGSATPALSKSIANIPFWNILN